MKDLEFKYEKIGHIIMIEESDWNRVVKYLANAGIKVDEADITKSVESGAKRRRRKKCCKAVASRDDVWGNMDLFNKEKIWIT